jgi:DNA-directed RNA polymerase specialized sigma subunit
MKEDDDITNIVLSDPFLTPREYVNQKEKEELLSKAKMTLTKPEQRVIKFIFDFGFSEAKTGRKMKISQEKVSQLKISALSKLNKGLKGKIE